MTAEVNLPIVTPLTDLERDGQLVFHAAYAADGTVVHVDANHEGGDLIAVSPEFVGGDMDSRWFKIDGMVLTACQYTLDIIGWNELHHYYVARLEKPQGE